MQLDNTTNIIPGTMQYATNSQTNFDSFPSQWRFTPIRANSKSPIGNEWGKNPMDWDSVKALVGRYYKNAKVGAIGVICGEASGGLLMVDHDGDSVDAMLNEWGVSLPRTWKVHGHRKGHYQLAYWVDSQYWDAIKMAVYKTGEVGADGKLEQLEFRWGALGEQKQSIIFGEHPDTKQFYTWENLDILEIPHAPLWIIEKMLKGENRAESIKSSPKLSTDLSDSELAKMALEAINPEPLTWYVWRDCLLAAHGSGVSESDVLAWSRTSSKHTDSGFQDVWKYIKGHPNGLGVGTLIYLAKKEGWQPPKKKTSRSSEFTSSQGEKMTTAQLAEKLKLDVGRLIRITDPYERKLEERKLCEAYRISKPDLEGLIRTTVRGGLTESRAPRLMTFEEALKLHKVAEDWLVEEWIPAKANILLTGLSGTGKTRLCADLAVSLAMGTDWMGFKTRKARVLFLGSDQQLHHTIRYLDEAGYNSIENNIGVVGQADGMAAWTVNRMDLLEQWMEDFKPDFVIGDSVVAIASDPVGLELKDQAVATWMRDVQSIVNAKGAGVLWVCHDVKSNEAVGVNRAAGSGQIPGAVDIVWNFDKTNPKNPQCPERRLYVSKTRQGSGYNALVEMNPETHSFEYKGAPGESEEQVAKSKRTKDAILEYLAECYCTGLFWVKGKAIAEYTATTNAYTEMGRLLHKGVIHAKPDESAANRRFKVYSLPESAVEQYAKPESWNAFLRKKERGEFSNCESVATNNFDISSRENVKNEGTPPTHTNTNLNNNNSETTTTTGFEVTNNLTNNLTNKLLTSDSVSKGVLVTSKVDTPTVSGHSEGLLTSTNSLGGEGYKPVNNTAPIATTESEEDWSLEEANGVCVGDVVSYFPPNALHPEEAIVEALSVDMVKLEGVEYPVDYSEVEVVH